MGYQELKLVKAVCDGCKHELVFIPTRYHVYDGALRLYHEDLPRGWRFFEGKPVHDCGLTGYTRTEKSLLCPDCVKAQEQEDARPKSTEIALPTAKPPAALLAARLNVQEMAVFLLAINNQRATDPTLLPAIRSLEKQGLIRVDWSDCAIDPLISLTDAGRKLVRGDTPFT